MSVRHTAGTVFKTFAAHVAVFFMRMADFAPAVFRVPRNVMAVMMFMSAATTSLVFMMMVFMPTATTIFMFMVMLSTAASPIFMVVMRAHLITAVSYIR